jgi:SAM-dependent methyltransferase
MAIRQEAFGEDIGQNSWLTANEQDMFLEWLELSAQKTLLDIACGSGGPALRMAGRTGCSLVGIDVHEQAIATAELLASQRNLKERSEFYVVNASEQLPFPDARFDAITCIDAINHLPNRPLVIAEWARLLKPGGRLLFTDPATVTGPLTNEEIAVRSSAGFYLFVPPDYDKEVIVQSGLRLLVCRDVTANMAAVAEKRRAARDSRSTALRQVEDDRAYEAQQNFLAMTARLAGDSRLSRMAYLSEKVG